MIGAKAWARVTKPEFIIEHNPMIYFLGNTFCVATAEGVIIEEDWPEPLTHEQKIQLLALAIRRQQIHFHNAMVSPGNWIEQLEAMMQSGDWTPVALMYRGNTAILVDQLDPDCDQHPDYAAMLADYKRQKGLR